VDWGGGGEDEISLTALAVLGLLPDGQIHVLWGRRLMTPHDSIGEADICLMVFKQFKCHMLAHDYSGAGSVREGYLVNSRLPLDRIVPIAYVRASAANIINYKQATNIHPRNYYTVDKTRSLLLTCAMIKFRRIKFFKFDRLDDENPGLISDFLGLVENKIATKRTSDIYTIQRHATLPDDFAQAVNIGCCALWHSESKWPNLAQARRLMLDENQAKLAGTDQSWREELMERPDEPEEKSDDEDDRLD
jgi:hypothetical protein